MKWFGCSVCVAGLLGLWGVPALAESPLKCFAKASGYGCENTQKQVLVPFQFRQVAVPAKGMTVFVQHTTGVWQGYDLTKKQLIPQDTLIRSFTEPPDFINPKEMTDPIHETGHINWQGYEGLVDRVGKLLIPPVYERLGATGFHPMIALYQGKPLLLPAVKDGRAGMIDATGRIVVPFEFDDVIQHHPWAHIAFLFQGKQVYIVSAQTGQRVLPQAFDWVETSNPYEGVFAAKYQGKMGLIDVKTLKVVVPFAYADIGMFNYSGEIGWYLSARFFDGFTGVKNEAGKWGIMTDKNTLVVPYEFDQIVHGESYNTHDPNMKRSQEQAAAARHKLVAFVKLQEQVVGYLDSSGTLHRLKTK